jgi:hypothetical protein
MRQRHRHNAPGTAGRNHRQRIFEQAVCVEVLQGRRRASVTAPVERKDASLPRTSLQQRPLGGSEASREVLHVDWFGQVRVHPGLPRVNHVLALRQHGLEDGD